MAPFSAQNLVCFLLLLTTLDGVAAKGYVAIPPVEGTVAMQLCPRSASTWRGNPCLPSKACKSLFSQPRLLEPLDRLPPPCMALKELHKGSSDLGLMQEMCTETNLTLRVMKVTVCSLGQTMATLVIQECHFWLNLGDMGETNIVFSTPLFFGDAVKNFT